MCCQRPPASSFGSRTLTRAGSSEKLCTLSTLLPLLLGVLTVAGLVLRDPQRLDALYQTLLVLVPCAVLAVPFVARPDIFCSPFGL